MIMISLLNNGNQKLLYGGTSFRAWTYYTIDLYAGINKEQMDNINPGLTSLNLV